MKFILGLLLGLVLVPLGIYLYLAGGSAPVATTDSDMPFERFFAHKILDARIARDMPKNVPLPANESNYLPGAELYKQHCAVYHGLPLAPSRSCRSRWMRSMKIGLRPHLIVCAPIITTTGRPLRNSAEGEYNLLPVCLSELKLKVE